MPTCYASPIEDNENFTFEQYLFRCARAFGALVSMRDMAMDAPLPEKIEPSLYTKKELEKRKAALLCMQAMTDESLAIQIEFEYNEKVAKYEKELSKKERTAARYEEMRRKVSEWVAPTASHQQLKGFMLEQISISESDYTPDYPKSPIDVKEYRTHEITRLNREIAYYQVEYDKEVSISKRANEWLQALKDSIKKETV